MSNFKHTVCEPLNPQILDKGVVTAAQILPIFQQFPWDAHLKSMLGDPEPQVYFSPSLEFANLDTGVGFTASIVDHEVFYLYFQRPKKRKYLFGLFEKMDNTYLSELRDQSTAETLACLNALITNDLEFLEQKFAGH